MTLRASFARAAAVLYTAGTVFHVVRLLLRLDLADMPFLPDWIIAIVGSWAAAGMIRFAGEVRYRGRWEIVTHWLIVAHLLASVVLHVWILAVRSHDVLGVFPYGYSYFGLVYFAFFAWRCWTMRLQPPTPAR